MEEIDLFEAGYQTQRNLFGFPGKVFTFKGALKTGHDLILREDGTAAEYSMTAVQMISPVFASVFEVEAYRLVNGDAAPSNQPYMD